MSLCLGSGGGIFWALTHLMSRTSAKHAKVVGESASMFLRGESAVLSEFMREVGLLVLSAAILHTHHIFHCSVTRMYMGLSPVQMLHSFPSWYLGLEHKVGFADGTCNTFIFLLKAETDYI